MKVKYDFGGWATRNDLLCADGRTIRQNAFADNDGQTVPLVWMHQHNEPSNVLGHALLENRPQGVYAYCSFNDSDAGRNARELVSHGDVSSLSIYANKLKQHRGNVYHGVIREVSLVLAGANPGAYIEELSVEHSDDGDISEAELYNDIEELDLVHEEPEEEPEEYEDEEEYEEDEETEEYEEDEEDEGDIAHAGMEDSMDENMTVQDVLDGMTEEQLNVMYFMIGKALENADTAQHAMLEDLEDSMKYNVFDEESQGGVLTHADMDLIFSDAKRLGSLRDAVMAHQENGVLAHASDEQGAYLYDHADPANKIRYGVADIDYLFPDYKNLNTTPEFIQRKNDWVTAVMNGVHHTPFSRIKSQFADITMDEARAKGYIKGNLKKEEVFSLLKRTTDPQTIYKKQKLDRDDVVDITDFDVVAWIKGEMRIMLDEEIARAILIGDGRLSSDDDKISADHIRPIWTDSDLFTIKKTVNEANTTDDTVKDIIRAVVKARKDYRGSGNLTAFMSEDMLADTLLLEDGFGHALYADEQAICRKLRCNRIVTVPQFENLTDTNGNKVAIIMVDLKDYNVGADKGGSVNMFDDFDIDYNQQKYLIETRCSGALTKPYSAMVFSIVPAQQGGGT